MKKLNTLKVTIDQTGGFYKAFHNGIRIYKFDLFQILEINLYSGFTLQHHLDKFNKQRDDYYVEYTEIDVN